MSNNIIRQAVIKMVRSEEFLQSFTDHFLVQLEQQLRSEAPGESVYIPKQYSYLDKQNRDAKIRKMFNGNNHKELATKFGLTVRHIRNICHAK